MTCIPVVNVVKATTTIVFHRDVENIGHVTEINNMYQYRMPIVAIVYLAHGSCGSVIPITHKIAYLRLVS
jgi:hypothetical protein